MLAPAPVVTDGPLNPNNPMIQAMAGMWHKVAAILMHKMEEHHVIITMDDLKSLGDGQRAITLEEQADGIHLKLVTMAEAKQLAAATGGVLQS